jgi:hypothetical protein
MTTPNKEISPLRRRLLNELKQKVAARVHERLRGLPQSVRQLVVEIALREPEKGKARRYHRTPGGGTGEEGGG